MNRFGALLYEHDNAPDVSILPGIGENAARNLSKQMLAAAGQWVAAPKRDPRAVRERQALDRRAAQQEKNRHEQLLNGLRDERERLGHLNSTQRRAIESRIADTEREIAFYTRLMTEVPASSRMETTA